MASVRLEGIEKVFPGGHEALVDVNLEVADGELVVLLGPSGCGKSTLLRIVAGIEAPTRGRLFIGKEDVTDLPPQKRDVAMVFQNYALYPHMSVRDNLAFGIRMRGLDRAEIGERVATVSKSLGISELLDRKPSQLSGGQRQRVALGRAIARDAKVFMLDEPLSNLDLQLRQSTRRELARLHRQVKVPMLYVTHDQEEAMTLGDRVVVLRAGRVLQIGTPMEVYAKPRNLFVAGFVGSPRMNFLRGRLEPGDSVADPARIGVRVVLDPEVSGRPQPGVIEIGGTAAGTSLRLPCDVIAGVRPEDLEIVDAEEGAAADLLARVDLVEPLGREHLLHLFREGAVPDGGAGRASGGGGGTMGPGAAAGAGAGSGAGAELRVLAEPSRRIAAGARIGLRLRRDRLHLFDPGSEERIEERIVR
ncbi:MAG: ABC transporter ATP-binding protein [Candidatus Eisenbacteria bacterium]